MLISLLQPHSTCWGEPRSHYTQVIRVQRSPASRPEKRKMGEEKCNAAKSDIDKLLSTIHHLVSQFGDGEEGE